MKIVITVKQFNSALKDPHLTADREFWIVFNLDDNAGQYIRCEIDGQPNCYINRQDLLYLMRVMGYGQT